MSDPVILRLVRPYSTVDEYLNAEANTIHQRGMLLVDAEALAEGTIVRFLVSLESGEALIKAEGRVRRHIPPRDGRVGGLEVRFKRFGGATKQLIDRAVALSSSPRAREPDVESSPHSAPIQHAEVSTPDAAPPPSSGEAEAEQNSLPPLSAAPATITPPVGTSGEASGVHHRPVIDIEPPPNRDVLLDKLRERARQMSDAKLASFSKDAKAG